MHLGYGTRRLRRKKGRALKQRSTQGKLLQGEFAGLEMDVTESASEACSSKAAGTGYVRNLAVNSFAADGPLPCLSSVRTWAVRPM